jgi:hypothetical protein
MVMSNDHNKARRVAPAGQPRLVVLEDLEHVCVSNPLGILFVT